MGGRAVEGARLESVYTVSPYRGFESHPIRHKPPIGARHFSAAPAMIAVNASPGLTGRGSRAPARRNSLLRGSVAPIRKHLATWRSFSCATGAKTLLSDMTKHHPELSLLFHALADPTRRSILTRLAERPARVTDLFEPTGLRLPTVMRHLSVLEEAGLIATSKEGRVRTCAIVPEALDPVRGWLDEQRAIWEGRLDRLDAFAMKAMKERTE